MRVLMNFGREGLPLELDDSWDLAVIRKPPMPLLPDPPRAVAEALAHPLGCPALRDLAGQYRRACILICDITRPVPNGLILPVLLRQLLEGGMHREQISLLVATGLHRPNLGEELREVVGDDWVLKNFRIDNHDARCEADHVDLGHTSQGIPIRLNRRLVEADLRLAIGLVEPHFMAGYSGGRKLIMPGVAHHHTIRRLHSAALLEHPLADNCRLDGNPLHQQQLEIVEKLGVALAVNVVLDDQRRLGFVNFGPITASHLAAVEFVRRYAQVDISRRFPTVITSAAGYPLDRTYYQTVKGMVSALGALEEGGDLIIVSQCSEGLGSPQFIEAQQRLLASSPRVFHDSLLARTLPEVDEWQTQMQLKAMRRGRIFLWAPGLSAQQVALTGVQPISSLLETICHSATRRAGRPAVAVIPEGPYVIPVCQDSK